MHFDGAGKGTSNTDLSQDARVSNAAERYLREQDPGRGNLLRLAAPFSADKAANVVCTRAGCHYRATIRLVSAEELSFTITKDTDHTCPLASFLPCSSAKPSGEADCIAPGDVVILVVGVDKIMATKIIAGQVYASAYGKFHHDDMIGKPYGAKLFSRTKTGFVFALRFSPSLWTRSMDRRTQILFVPDISLITMRANLQPGSRVCEAGVGSGSLTHHLLQRIYPGGHLFSCDIDESRAKLAEEEVLSNYLSLRGLHGMRSELQQTITISYRDVGAQGFQNEATDIDFVFLDLPNPETVIPHLKRSLKIGGLCTVFVPCLEQVHAAISAFCENGFGSLETIKSFSITYEASVRSLPIPPLYRPDNADTTGSLKPVPPKRGGIRAHVSANISDTIEFSGLTPTKLMRTHTGFLVSANYFGTTKVTKKSS